MITRCPSCATHFRVHAEQLAARAGQVRCGKCSRVFDALEYLIEERAPLRGQPVAVEPAPAQASQAGAGASEPVISQDLDFGLESTPIEAAAAGSVLSDSVALQPAGETVDILGDAPAFEFGPRAAADPSRRARRWPWLLGALCLLALLLAQAAYYYRSALIVLFPQAKPYAAALCAKLGCDLPLPRRVDMMSIEASDLQADTANPNVMVLSATLKNRAVFDQQLPLLELTLTDAQDQPVVRRVLAPRDYIGKAANVGVGFAANGEIAIKVFIEGSQVKATGYRLYLFYP